jgi:putative SOS response-associated peptidase YedK
MMDSWMILYIITVCQRWSKIQGMCGRFVSPAQADLERYWHIGGRSNPNPFRGTFNAAPSQLLPVMRSSSGGELELDLDRWGFQPPWAAKVKPQINARAETVASKPLFRSAFKASRCLVPTCGWYEWTVIAGEKWPHYVTRPDGQLFSFAGIETTAADGQRTYAIITTDASEDLRWLHSRMPLALSREAEEQWLGGSVQIAQDLLQSPETNTFKAVRVGKRVNSPANDDAGLIEAVE